MAECPCCAHLVEDKWHVIQCPATLAWQIWNELITKQKNWLQKEQMDCSLMLAILNGLQAWYNGAYAD